MHFFFFLLERANLLQKKSSLTSSSSSLASPSLPHRRRLTQHARGGRWGGVPGLTNSSPFPSLPHRPRLTQHARGGRWGGGRRSQSWEAIIYLPDASRSIINYLELTPGPTDAATLGSESFGPFYFDDVHSCLHWLPSAAA